MNYQRTRGFVRRHAVPIKKAGVVFVARLAGGCVLYVPVALKKGWEHDAKGGELQMAVTADEEEVA